MFGLPGTGDKEKNKEFDKLMEDVLKDEDVRKLDRLQLINASARYELLSANQQLIDFHLNRVMKSMFTVIWTYRFLRASWTFSNPPGGEMK